MPIYTRAKRVKLLNQLNAYFSKKGKVLSPTEYRDATDTPFSITPQVIRKAFGNWGKMQNAINIQKAKTPSPPPTPTKKAKPAPAVKKVTINE